MISRRFAYSLLALTSVLVLLAWATRSVSTVTMAVACLLVASQIVGQEIARTVKQRRG